MPRLQDVYRRMNVIHQRAVNESRGLTAEEQREWDQLHRESTLEGNTFRPGAVETTQGPATDVRLRNAKTGEAIRVYGPDDSWTRGREYDLPDGIQPEELDLGRWVRAIVRGDWKHAQAELRAMGEGTGSIGGYAVPTVLSDRIIASLREKLATRAAGLMTITLDDGPVLRVARELTRPRAAWVGENDPAIWSEPTFGAVNLEAKRVSSLVKSSRELMEDASNLESLLLDSMGHACAQAVDRAVLYGSGLNQPLGIINAEGAGVQKTDLSGASLSIDHVVKAIYRLAARNVPTENLAAIMSASSAYALATAREDGTAGGYLEGSPPAAYAKLRRFSSEVVPTSATTEVFIGLFSAYLLGIRRDLTIEITNAGYDETNGESAFQRNQVYIHASLRCDGAPIQPSAFEVLTNVADEWA